MSRETLTRLFISLNDKDTKKQILSTKNATIMIKNTLMENKIDGATIYNSKGLYRHLDGGQVNENTIIVELLFTPRDIVNLIAGVLKKRLNQESIALQEIELNKCELV